MTDQEQAFEVIKKARKNKVSKITALQKAGFEIKKIQGYIDQELIEYNNKNLKYNPPQEITEKKSSIKYEEKDNAATLNSKGSIRTLEELLEEAKVDLNIWTVDRHQINKWEMGAKDSDGEIVVTPLWQVKAWLKKKQGVEDATELLEFFKKELAANINNERWNDVEETVVGDKPYCLELAIPDLHLGKLGWSSETGSDNYDSNEAVRIFELAVKDLISKAPMDQVEQILFVLGNDFYHTDNAKDETTSGTYVGTDSRWQKTFMKGCTLLTEVISRLAIDRQVIVPIVPGNHDFERSFYLGEYLKAFFHAHPNVKIDNTPTARKYFRYGNTLIGFTHGNEEKHSTLPLILATERPVDWSETRFREWHVGHLHKESNNEYAGVKVKFLAALCPSDSWHAKKGYIGSTRSATAFLYHYDKGLEAQYYFNI